MTTRKRLSRLLPALALSVCAASSAEAQVGLGLGLRSVSGNEANTANSDRQGYELRAFWDGRFNPALGWRTDLAGVQMLFQRDDGTRRFTVTENGLEASASLRADGQSGSLSGLYALAGPTFSVRLLCGASGNVSSNGRVACDEGERQRLGYHLGVGYASRVSARRELLFELRYLGGVVAGAGNPVIALGIGLRGH